MVGVLCLSMWGEQWVTDPLFFAPAFQLRQIFQLPIGRTPQVAHFYP